MWKLVLLVMLASCAHVRPVSRSHPLDPLGAVELARSIELVRAHFAADPSLPKDSLRMPLVALAEPPKADVLAWREGSFSRSSEVQVLHGPSARLWIARVDLTQNKVALRELDKGLQPGIALSEYREASEAVRKYEPWLNALRSRGLDPNLAFFDLWAPGHMALPADVQLSHGEQTRLLRALTFYAGGQRHPYDRPVEGLVVTIDLNAMKVVHLLDTGARPVSSDHGEAESVRTLAPLHTAQKSSDITLEGRRVNWQGFSFLLGFHPRDGVVFYSVEYANRPIAHRMSLSEIYVPYGLGDPAWSWRSAFDVGEYNAGSAAQSLDVGADVPEHALLLDESVASEQGVRSLPRVIGVYERDAGLLWTRTEPHSGARDSRRARELVVTWNTVVGNYIYAFDWVFKLDGSIEVVSSLHGTTLNRGTTEAPEASAPKIGRDAQGVYTAAPHHQHFFSFRLDLDVDGPDNGVMEMDVVPIDQATHKNAFDTTMLHFEQEGARDVAPHSVRHWHVESGHARNALGKPTSFSLEPGNLAVPYSAADFPGLARGGFAAHQLWFTRYRDDERYAAGDFPNQAASSQGVPRFIEPAEPLTPRDDVVLWYTTGFTHVSRPEDHPVMTGESISFRLVPRGFFARNPALDVQDQRPR